MNVKLKVCGMRDAGNILQVASLHPDYMGFIFYPQSPRFIGKDFTLPKEFPNTIKRVGVFVNESTDRIKALVKNLDLDFVQLHGNESVEDCSDLKSSGVGVIKVFSVGSDFDFQITKPYQPVVDFFLFDTKGKLFGGNAKTFDWSILQNYDQKIPFFLSGGLSEDNISAIASLSKMNIHALDLNSGIEIEPGIKSIERLGRYKQELKNLTHN